MCYHISFEIKLESITDYFPDLVIDPQYSLQHTPVAHLDGFTHPTVWTMVKSTKDGKRHLPSMMWGFLPNYIPNIAEAQKYWNGYKDETGVWHKGLTTLNAKGEELFDKKLYKNSAENRRCVIFIDGFYESTHIFQIGVRGKQLKTPVTYPHYITINDGNPFMMAAGIWTPWRHTEVDKETGEIVTIITTCFAICTTKATDKMAKIHNSKERMPTFLTKQEAEEWIEDGLTKERIIQLATKQYPDDKIDAYSVDREYYKNANPKEPKTYVELANMFC